jgi:hypothetical protein
MSCLIKNIPSSIQVFSGNRGSGFPTTVANCVFPSIIVDGECYLVTEQFDELRVLTQAELDIIVNCPVRPIEQCYVALQEDGLTILTLNNQDDFILVDCPEDTGECYIAFEEDGSTPISQQSGDLILVDCPSIGFCYLGLENGDAFNFENNTFIEVDCAGLECIIGLEDNIGTLTFEDSNQIYTQCL